VLTVVLEQSGFRRFCWGNAKIVGSGVRSYEIINTDRMWINNIKEEGFGFYKAI